MMNEQQQLYPFKLYEMIEYACDSKFSSALSWSDDGSFFIIHDKEIMMNDLAPKFFKQTQFRSFTRQLNIWGFVRCETLGGERDGWQHKDKDFIRGRPDLLTKIKRIPVKSKSNVKKIASVTTKSKASASSRSARGGVLKATVEKKIASVSDESSCSSSSLDSQASSYSGGNIAHVPATQGVATFPVAQDHGSVFQYFAAPISHLNYVHPSSLQVQGSVSSMPPLSDSFNNETSMQQIEPIPKHDVDNNIQPFNDDELVYLASIFEDDEKHSSGNDDLASILSLNQEASVEDFIFGL